MTIAATISVAMPPMYRAAALTQPKFSAVTVNFKLSGNRQAESEIINK